MFQRLSSLLGMLLLLFYILELTLPFHSLLNEETLPEDEPSHLVLLQHVISPNASMAIRLIAALDCMVRNPTANSLWHKGNIHFVFKLFEDNLFDDETDFPDLGLEAYLDMFRGLDFYRPETTNDALQLPMFIVLFSAIPKRTCTWSGEGFGRTIDTDTNSLRQLCAMIFCFVQSKSCYLRSSANYEKIIRHQFFVKTENSWKIMQKYQREEHFHDFFQNVFAQLPGLYVLYPSIIDYGVSKEVNNITIRTAAEKFFGYVIIVLANDVTVFATNK